MMLCSSPGSSRSENPAIRWNTSLQQAIRPFWSVLPTMIS